ncbi:hypothetical protein JQ625_27300 [Bradyrhizobium diazoefficiens]|nr:hypothetical protein [Bradyrhizobium diazoefficiens]MBR0778556.1 hypothetical protein [Bradyrhizobium diazoefficiens]
MNKPHSMFNVGLAPRANKAKPGEPKITCASCGKDAMFAGACLVQVTPLDGPAIFKDRTFRERTEETHPLCKRCLQSEDRTCERIMRRYYFGDIPISEGGTMGMA